MRLFSWRGMLILGSSIFSAQQIGPTVSKGIKRNQILNLAKRQTIEPLVTVTHWDRPAAFCVQIRKK